MYHKITEHMREYANTAVVHTNQAFHAIIMPRLLLQQQVQNKVPKHTPVKFAATATQIPKEAVSVLFFRLSIKAPITKKAFPIWRRSRCDYLSLVFVLIFPVMPNVLDIVVFLKHFNHSGHSFHVVLIFKACIGLRNICRL